MVSHVSMSVSFKARPKHAWRYLTSTHIQDETVILEIAATILTISLWWASRKMDKRRERVATERNQQISKRALIALLRELDLDPNMRRLVWLFGAKYKRPRMPPHR